MTTGESTETLTQSECWALLGRECVGRLAVATAGRPDIFPINYVVDADTIVFRSSPGTKFAAAVLGRDVAFEIDGADRSDRTVWSVVVKGTAFEVDNAFERFRIEDLPLYPWVAGDKPRYVQIEPSLVTGRRFHVVPGSDAAGDPARTTRSSAPGG
jgi:hypothetical protein